MRGFLKIAGAVVVAVAITACASAGKNFSVANANKVQNGMTREEVIRVMGSKPYSIVGAGGKTFIWSYAKANALGSTSSRAVRFNFDDDGKVYGVPEGGVFGDIKKYAD